MQALVLTNGNATDAPMVVASCSCWTCLLDDNASTTAPGTACATHLPFLQFALGLRERPHWRRHHAFHLSAGCWTPAPPPLRPHPQTFRTRHEVSSSPRGTLTPPCRGPSPPAESRPAFVVVKPLPGAPAFRGRHSRPPRSKPNPPGRPPGRPLARPPAQSSKGTTRSRAV